MVIKNTSLRLEESYMQELKLLAVKRKTTQSKLLNEFIKDGLLKNGVKLD